MNILQIRKFCENRKIEWTSHAAKRLLQRGISSSDVAAAIDTGDIIENYPEDYPFPSCLIVGKTTKGRVMHIVCSIGDEKLWIITAYEPKFDRLGFRISSQKGAKIMRCVFCKGSLEDKTSTFTVDFDERIVVVRNVPSHVCSQCGEVSYSDNVYRELEKVVDQMRDSISEVAIVNYFAKTA